MSSISFSQLNFVENKSFVCTLFTASNITFCRVGFSAEAVVRFINDRTSINVRHEYKPAIVSVSFMFLFMLTGDTSR